MKAVRIMLYGVGGLVALSVVALGAAAVIVDGKFVKAHLESRLPAWRLARHR